MATIFYTFYTHFQPDIYDFVLVAFTLFRGLLIPASITVLPQERHCHWTTASPGSCGQQQDTVCIGMLQMLKLRSREASAIVKFVFLILLDLAGQFVDFVSFDGCDVTEAWSRAKEPSGLYHQTCFMLSPSTAP